MTLDARGDISAAEIVFYVPLLCISFVLVKRYGSKRDSGWIFLLTFSIIRIIGAVLLVVAESLTTPDQTLLDIADAFVNVGLTPLLLATLGFLGIVGQHALSKEPLVSPQIMNGLRYLLMATLFMGTISGALENSSNDKTSNTGYFLRKLTSIFYAVAYIVVVFVIGIFWTHRDQILRQRRILLIGISASLPFLAVRVVYSIFSSFSPRENSAPNGLSKFNPTTGEWQIYLAMAVVMEFVTTTVYCTVGMVLPLQKEDYNRTRSNSGPEGQLHPLQRD